MSTRASNKAARLLQIEALLLAHPEGLTSADIARKLQVHRSTIGRYQADLPKHIYLDDLDGDRWKIDRDAYLVKVRFTMHEALALHLAARLMATHTDKHNPHAAAALRKIGIALESLAPFISEHVKTSADVMDDAARRHDPVYLDVLETLTRAWSLGRKVALKHQMPDGQVFSYTYAPYFIAPYAVGQTAHVIGWREPPGALRTFKVERIRSIKLLDDAYTIPADFDARALLTDAWGIWYTEREPVEVCLRFHHRVAQRVQETQWHPSQEMTPQTDGALLWRARIAEPREMLPWIRGWGGDVEVLAPASLRAELEREVRRMARVYGVGCGEAVDPQMEKLLRCWGKTLRGNDAMFHPALFHMLDVGNVARALLTDSAGQRWRQVLAHALDANAETLSDWLPYVIAMHDIGKLTVAFQRQNAVQSRRLQAEGFTFGDWQDDMWLHHTVFGQVYIQEEAANLNLSKAWQSLWRDVIGGHHGAFGSRQVLKTARTRLATREPPQWCELRILADHWLGQILRTGAMPQHPPTHLARATVALTGFTILCDWLGSDERFFPASADFGIAEYVPMSAERAQRAVQAAGFSHPAHSSAPVAFGELFPDKQPPRPLQTAIDVIPESALEGPALVIIEAPTGEGKTEAALAIAHRLAQGSGTDAFYYALPTTATSNQMFKRVRSYLDDNLALPVDVQLIHGQAHLREDDLEAQLLSNGKSGTEDAVAWFTSKKRAILAPFGVGTVDQAELAALNVKHVALRLMGLAGKVIIFDEVHAYDTYMTTIVARLLEWLSALGTSVIILSATLPQRQRAVLAQAYGATLPSDQKQIEAYPGLWVLPRDGEPYHATPEAYQSDRPLAVEYLHFIEDEAEAKAQWLLAAVRDGGCACWITNTVARAQAIYRALRDAPESRDVDLDLLHARFPLTEREQREKDLAKKYGPLPKAGENNLRPQRGIVIGTQVLEQSLDLDFDVMVSDLAPIDLLLQRAGRLQRHTRPRPAAYANGPTLWVNIPQDAQGEPDLGMDARIYDAYLLYQTQHTLENYGPILNLPSDYRPLVEAVYREDALVIDDKLAQSWKNLQEKQCDAIKQADARLLPEPTSGRAFCRRSAQITFEEDETGASWIVAQTRLGRESVNIIPMEKLDEATARLVPDGQPLALGQATHPAMQRQLLRHHLRVSRPEIVRALKKTSDLPPLFKRSSRLKGYYPLWLENGEARFPKLWGEGEVVVTLDANLGLVIT